MSWRWMAEQAVLKLARKAKPFTALEVRELVGDPPKPNAFGSVFRVLSQSGAIKRIGYKKSTRPTLHAHPIAVWVGVR